RRRARPYVPAREAVREPDRAREPPRRAASSSLLGFVVGDAALTRVAPRRGRSARARGAHARPDRPARVGGRVPASAFLRNHALLGTGVGLVAQPEGAAVGRAGIGHPAERSRSARSDAAAYP